MCHAWLAHDPQVNPHACSHAQRYLIFFLFSPFQYDAQVHTMPLIHQTWLWCLMYLQCWCLKSCGGREGGVALLCICICSAHPLLANFFLSSPLQYDAQVYAMLLIYQTWLQCLMCLQCWYLKQCSCGGRERRVASLCVCIWHPSWVMLNKVHVTTHAPLATSDNVLSLCPVPSLLLLTASVRVENVVTS